MHSVVLLLLFLTLFADNLISFEYEYVKHIFELQVKIEERPLQLFMQLKQLREKEA